MAEYKQIYDFSNEDLFEEILEKKKIDSLDGYIIVNMIARKTKNLIFNSFTHVAVTDSEIIKYRIIEEVEKKGGLIKKWQLNKLSDEECWKISDIDYNYLVFCGT